jgi:cation diffusion facilitator CzcD-associated flavoprotein CzcO
MLLSNTCRKTPRLNIDVGFTPVASSAVTKDICIVGAGPGGLSVLKIIKDTPQFKNGKWTVTAYEAREDIGGIW